MIKHAVSNIALPAYDHAGELAALAAAGIQGIEVAPSRVWRDTWQGLGPDDVSAYRKAVEAAGLQVVGLHSLFFDHPELGLFKDVDGRNRSLDFLVHLSAVCRDLGGRTLIWGGGRRRGEVPADAAEAEAVAFMAELCRRVEGHGTVFCFEPLGPADTDFINRAADALAIVRRVDHPALAVQLDAKALVDNAECKAATFELVKARLVHFHANEPGLGVLGRSGAVDHAALGAMLKGIGYEGFVSVEQRMFDAAGAMADVLESIAHLKRCYP